MCVDCMVQSNQCDGRKTFAAMWSGFAESLGIGGGRTLRAHNQEFVLRVVQPALVGFVDGSVSTLAPIFAVAFATRQPRIAFLVGVAASLGAAISMGLSEGLSDDGRLTNRGRPLVRGSITGAMTFAGGILHTLPFLIPHVQSALTLAFVVVAFELLIIAYIRHRYMEMSFWKSVIQIVIGGAAVVAAGILIGGG